jgi:phosphohistidine phosphatase SixA
MRHMIKIGLTVCMMLLPLTSLASPYKALREGGVVLLIRHAITEPGTGDPPGFQRDDCSTQRQLSAQGRAQAQALGERLSRQGITPIAVSSSAWCRCQETASLAFPGLAVSPLPALDSFFADGEDHAAAQTAALREALQRIPARGVTVWVSHQVNAHALTGQYLAMGEGLVLQPDGKGGVKILGRLGPSGP